MNEANTMADILGRETVDEAHARLGNTAPRVSPADIDANISAEYFLTGDKATVGCPQHESLRLLTICILVTRNGFVEVGTSAPASAENFNAELGRKYAREDAVKNLWPKMGYALREHLANIEKVRAAVDGLNAFAAPAPSPAPNDGFCGFLTADLPELHGVHPGRVADSWARFHAQVARGDFDCGLTEARVMASAGEPLIDHDRATDDGMPTVRTSAPGCPEGMPDRDV